MSKVNLKEISKKATEFENVESVQKALRSVQSRKSRFIKQKSRKDYETIMAEIVKEEQLLKEVRQYFEPKKKFVTKFTKSDIENLDYDETIKAIKSIQSKKTNTQFLTENIETNEEYQNALKIEAMLQEHKKQVKPIEDTTIRKSEIENLVNHIEQQEDKLSKEYVIELLQELL